MCAEHSLFEIAFGIMYEKFQGRITSVTLVYKACLTINEPFPLAPLYFVALSRSATRAKCSIIIA